jgi:cytochrome c-type biogenesis protein CcmH
MARLWVLLLLLASLGIGAKEAVPAAPDPALEARMQRIAAELRCLVCQNQTIADSNAALAEDLRREVRDQLRRGASDEQIVQYMTDRYGDFVRYRPPFKASTLVLWVGPAFAGGGLALSSNRAAPDWPRLLSLMVIGQRCGRTAP